MRMFHNLTISLSSSLLMKKLTNYFIPTLNHNNQKSFLENKIYQIKYN